MSQDQLLCCKRTYERNPAKHSTQRMYLRVVLSAASRPSHRKPCSLCTILQRTNENLVRHDWKGEEPPSNMHDVGAAAAPLALELNWATKFSYRFFEGKHVNLLELESLIQERRLLVWIRAWFWEPSQKDDLAHEKSTSCFENCGFGAL